jgi:hypothetical protein
MDPTQILLDIRATITNPRASNATAWEDLRDYWSWRRRGGFEPSIVVKTGSKNILTVKGDEYARTLARNIGRMNHEMPGILTLEVANA